MGTVDDYLDAQAAPRQTVMRALYDVALRTVPDAEQGTSYGMPALVYHGKPLVSVMAAKKHLSLFPFSSEIIEAFTEELSGFDVSKGTIRFQPEKPLSEALMGRLVEARKAQIDG